MASPACRTWTAAPPKLAVLIITGQNGHNWRGTTPLLRKTLEDTGKFDVRVTEEFRGAGPETLAPYDLVVLNYMERGRPELRWGEKTDAAFLDYVRSGKGVVVYHFAMAAFACAACRLGPLIHVPFSRLNLPMKSPSLRTWQCKGG